MEVIIYDYARQELLNIQNVLLLLRTRDYVQFFSFAEECLKNSKGLNEEFHSVLF